MARHVFVGEIELTKSYRSGDFENFESFPFIQLIHSVAERFSGTIEMMPYQRQGETPKLAVAVYQRPKVGSGRKIVILVKEDYPQSKQALASLVKKANRRLKTLATRTTEFDQRSVEASRKKVRALVHLVVSSLH